MVFTEKQHTGLSDCGVGGPLPSEQLQILLLFRKQMAVLGGSALKQGIHLCRWFHLSQASSQKISHQKVSSQKEGGLL